MSTNEKLAISVPRPLAERTRRAVRNGAAARVSAYVAAALEAKTKMDDLAALFDEMLAASGGPLTARERTVADQTLGIRPNEVARRRCRTAG